MYSDCFLPVTDEVHPLRFNEVFMQAGRSQILLGYLYHVSRHGLLKKTKHRRESAGEARAKARDVDLVD